MQIDTNHVGEADPAQPDVAMPQVESSVQSASSATSTGLTPEQVFQEIKKSGFLDQLRRQMFDAYVSSVAPAAPSVEPTSPPVSDTATRALNDAAHTPLPGADSTKMPSDTSTPATATRIDASATTFPPPASQGRAPTDGTHTHLDLGSKQALTTFLDTVLRPQLEKEHDRLRFQDARNQLDTLLKFLDSDPVAPPATNANDPQATLYEQLTAHIAKSAPPDQTSTTKGMLHKQGRLGMQVSARIAELVADLGQPETQTVNEDNDNDDDDDDDDDNDEGQSQGGHAVTTPETTASHAADESTVRMDV